MTFKVQDFVVKNTNQKNQKQKLKVEVLIVKKNGTIYMHLNRLIPRKKLYKMVDLLKLKYGTNRWVLVEQKELLMKYNPEREVFEI